MNRRGFLSGLFAAPAVAAVATQKDDFDEVAALERAFDRAAMLDQQLRDNPTLTASENIAIRARRSRPVPDGMRFTERAGPQADTPRHDPQGGA